MALNSPSVSSPANGPARQRAALLLFSALSLALVAGIPPRAFGATGWHVQLHGTVVGRLAKAYDVAVDVSGDAVVVGRVMNSSSLGDDFVVVRLDGASGAEKWRRELSADANDAARAVTIDSSGYVVAAGRLGGLAVVKLDGSTGADVWSTVIDPGVSGWVDSIALDAAGDVVVAGGMVGTVTKTDFAVVKFSGVTGAELWRRIIDGSESGPQADKRDQAVAVAVSASGDVIASGWLRNAGTGVTFTVIKFDGTTGAELWRQELNPGGRARALALDASGNVFAAGKLDPGPGKDSFAVVKLDGSSGSEVWRRELVGDYDSFNDGLAVAVDGAGDVVAAGTFNNHDTRNDFAVVKLSGSFGTEIWRREVRSGWIQNDAANAVAIDSDGNVIAAGRAVRRRRGPGPQFAVVKLDGLTGARLWLRELGATAQGLRVFDEAFAVAVDGAGNAVAAGVIDEEISGPNLAVVKLGAADGLTVGDCAATPRTDCLGGADSSRLAVADHTRPGPDPDRDDKLAWSWMGAPLTSFDSMGHILGATDLRLCVYDETAGLSALATDVVIPGGGTCGARGCWQRIGPPGDSRGYSYKGRGFSAAGIRKVSIRAANVPKAKLFIRSRGGALSLPGPVSASAYFVQDPSVTVQLVTSRGFCWDAAYTAGSGTNRSEKFKGRCMICP